MKQKLFIFIALILLFLLLIGLNALSYVQKEKIPDTEDNPNRSTYNVGATGTRAFYDLLAETGKDVTRWQDTFPTTGETEFSTFVIIGKTRKNFEDEEFQHILDWVSSGGKLVVIDRAPSYSLTSTTTDWQITQTESEESGYLIDSSNHVQMVGKTKAIKPSQTTIFTIQVNAVQPSKFASSINIEHAEIEEDSDPQTTEDPVDDESNELVESGNTQVDELFKTPSPTPLEPVETPTTEDVEGEETEEYIYQEAPVVHLTDGETTLLVDFPFGDGQIVFLSDPYIVSNGGIRLVDNAKLATNVVTSLPGIIAFDEYHQGFGSNENRLLQYFQGTPVVPIFLQILLIVALVFYSKSRRFARALPNDEQNRLSKLEYVSAMAQLQGRTKAFDLAVENIYTDFRRRVSKLFGVDNHTTSRKKLAVKIAERINRDVNEIEDLMFKCEDIMHGEPTKKKETVKLISHLRELEESLGLRRGKKRNSLVKNK